MFRLYPAPLLALLALFTAGCGATELPFDPGDPGDPPTLEVDGVTIVSTATEIGIGSSVQLIAAVTPVGVSQGVTWSSSDDTRLKVDANGLVTAELLPLDPATVTVTATSTEDPNFSASVELTIICGPLATSDVSNGATLPEDTCYVATSALVVTDGTLTLEPGVTISFGTAGSLSIESNARLSAVGTMTKGITLTSTDPLSKWRGVRFRDSRSADNEMHYVTLENGGSDGWSGASYSASALLLEGDSRVDMQMSEISGSDSRGFTAYGEADFSLGATAFIDNAVPAWLHPNTVEGLGTDNTFTGNTDEVIRISFGNNDAVSTAQTWADVGVPYELQERLFIQADLRIDPGTIIEATADVDVIVRDAGSLHAAGLPASPVQIRGSEDERGWWKGIQIRTQSASNVFENTLVEHGGSDQWTGAPDSRSMIYLDGNSKLLLEDVSLRDSDHYALWVPSGGDVSGMTGVVIETSARGMIVHPNRVGEIDQVALVDNDDNTIRITFGNNDRVETAQTWKNHGASYRVMDRTFVRGALTIEPGTTVEFEQGAHLIVDDGGSLNAVGTAVERITFRGREALSSYWKGIEFETVSVSNRIEYADFLHAGSDAWTGGANATATIHVTADGSLVMENSTFGMTGGYAAIIRNGGSLACTSVDDGGFLYYVYTGGSSGAQGTCPG